LCRGRRDTALPPRSRAAGTDRSRASASVQALLALAKAGQRDRQLDAHTGGDRRAQQRRAAAGAMLGQAGVDRRAPQPT
jgi:hypothetical protein